MKAKAFVRKHGKALVGRMVETEAIGEWPGGPAKVTDLGSDPMAPEIVMNVRSKKHGEMGIFEYEEIDFSEVKP